MQIFNAVLLGSSKVLLQSDNVRYREWM